MYTVTSLPFDNRARAILRKAEFGFLGVMVFTCRHTPCFCGQPPSTGDFVRLDTQTPGGAGAEPVSILFKDVQASGGVRIPRRGVHENDSTGRFEYAVTSVEIGVVFDESVFARPAGR